MSGKEMQKVKRYDRREDRKEGQRREEEKMKREEEKKEVKIIEVKRTVGRRQINQKIKCKVS